MKPKSLIGFTLDQNYSFNLNQINTVLRREIKNTPRKDIIINKQKRLKICGSPSNYEAQIYNTTPIQKNFKIQDTI